MNFYSSINRPVKTWNAHARMSNSHARIAGLEIPRFMYQIVPISGLESPISRNAAIELNELNEINEVDASKFCKVSATQVSCFLNNIYTLIVYNSCYHI